MLSISLRAVEDVPRDYFLSLRIGDVQKFAKAGASRTYNFPASAAKDRKNATIEIYRRLSVSNVSIEPMKLQGPHEVQLAIKEARKWSSDLKYQVEIFGEGRPLPSTIEPEKPALKEVEIFNEGRPLQSTIEPEKPALKEVEEPQRRSSKGDDSLMNELKAAAEYHTSHSEVSAFQQSAIRHCRHQLHQLSEEQNCMSEPYNNLGRYLDKCSATACLHEELQAVLQVQQNSQGDSNASITDFAEGRLQWVEKAESTLQIQHDQLKYDLEEMRQHTKVGQDIFLTEQSVGTSWRTRHKSSKMFLLLFSKAAKRQ